MSARRLALAALSLVFVQAVACSRPGQVHQLVARDDQLDAGRAGPATTGDVFANDQAASADLPLRLRSFTQGSRGDVRYNGDGTFTWEPRPGAASGADAFSYTVEDDAGAQSTATVQVRIAAGWGKPTTLVVTGGFPTLALGSGGRLVAAWIEPQAGISRLLARHRDPATGAWSTAEPVDSGSGTAAFGTLALADDGGGISLVWGQADAGGGEGLWLRRLSAAGVWEVQATRLSPAGATTIDDWWGAAVPGGGLLLAWQQQNATHAMWARRQDAAGTWSAAQQVEAAGIGTSDSRDARVVPLAGGGALACWKASAGTLGNVFCARAGATGGFGAAAQVGAIALDTWSIAPLTDGGATALVTDSQRQVFGHRLSAAGSWAAATPVSVGRVGTIFPNWVKLTDGGALAVWNEWPSARKELWANRLRPDGSWDGARLVDGGEGFSNDFSFAAVPGGGAVAVWSQDFFLGGTNARAATMDAAGTWGAPALLPDSQLRSGPVVDAAGTVHLLRISADPTGGTSSMWVEALGTGSQAGAAVRLGGATPPFVTLRTDAGTEVPLAAWIDGAGVDGSLWASRLTGGVWGRAERVAGSGGAPAGALLLRGLADGSAVLVGFSDGTTRTCWANDWR